MGEVGNVAGDDAPQFALVAGVDVVVVEVGVTGEYVDATTHAAA